MKRLHAAFASSLLAACAAPEPVSAPPPDLPQRPVAAPAPPLIATPSTVAATGPDLPARWWRAAALSGTKEGGDASLIIGTAPDELVFVKGPDQVRFLPAHLDASGPDSWNFTVRAAMHCVLGKAPPPWTLTCTDQGKVEAFRLEPASDLPRIAAIVAKNRPPPDSCPRAEACLAVGLRLLHAEAKVDLDAELGQPRELQRCAQTFVAMREAFAAMKKPLPDACKPSAR